MAKLTAAGLLTLQKKNVSTYYQVTINSVVCNDIKKYSYSQNRDFAAATLSLEIENSDGRYSPGGASVINLNDVIQLIEGLYTATGVLETLNKFKGIVRQRAVSKSGGINTIVITVMDYICRLEELDFDKSKDSPTTSATSIEMGYTALVGSWANYADTFTFKDSGGTARTNICPSPEPIIKIKSITGDYQTEPLFEGFDINYETGKLRCSIPQRIDKYRLFASFSYYPVASAFYVEDLIKEIIIEPDDNGTAVFDANTYLTSTYLTEEDSLPDTMIPNYSAVTIENVSYDIGRVWYTKYDNVITNLKSATNFTIGGGGVYSDFNQRYGALILNAGISTASIVTCDVTYSFYTTQASGISVPFIDLTTRSIKNRYDAIQKLKELCAPNYVIFQDGTGKIWSRFLEQSTIADYTLYLEKSLDYAESADVYTRVKVYGQSANPKSLIDSNTTFSVGFSYTQATGGWTPVAYDAQGDYSIWRCFAASTTGNMEILSSPAPKLLFDGVELASSKPHTYGFTPGGDGRPKDVSVNTNWQGEGLYSTSISVPSVYSKYAVYFQDSDVIATPDHPVYFHDRLDNIIHSITSPYFTAGGNTYTQLFTYNGLYILPSSVIESAAYSELYIGYSAPFRGFEILINAGNEGYNYSIIPSYYMLMSFAGYSYIDFKPCADLGQFTTQTLMSWGNAGTVGGIGRDGTSYSYPILKSFYGCYESTPVFMSKTTINGQELYWFKIVNKTKPSVIGYAARIGVVTNNFSSPVNPTAVFEYDSTTGWTDYTTQAQGNGNIPILDKPNIGMALQLGGKASYTCMYVDGYDWRVGKIDGAPHLGSRFFINNNFFDSEYEKYEPDKNGVEMSHDIKVDFTYQTSIGDFENFMPLKDGNPDTQYQIVRKSPMAAGSIVFNADFLAIKDIDAIDLTQGFYNPLSETQIGDGAARYDVENWYSLQYSSQDVAVQSVTVWNYLHKDSYNFKLSAGQSISFDREKLGQDFKARHLRLIIEQQSKVDYADGRYVVPIVSFAVWQDTILDGEAYLTTDTTLLPLSSDDTVRDNRRGRLNDVDTLLAKYGEKVYKDNEIKTYLNDNAKVRNRAFTLLSEFVKNHTTAKTTLAYAPHLKLGQTVKIVDSINSVNRNYFLESIDNSAGEITLQLAYYP
jgi:hypothetical protein